MECSPQISESLTNLNSHFTPDQSKRIAFFLSNLDGGGAQRTMINLAGCLAQQGHTVDLVLARMRGPLIDEISPSIRVHTLGLHSPLRVLPHLLRLPPSTRKVALLLLLANRPKIIKSLSALVHFLCATPPHVLLTTLDPSNLVALWATWLAKGKTRIVIREANTLSKQITGYGKTFEKHLPFLAREWYPRADKIIAVSDGVAEDLASVTGLPNERITTIYNPIDLPRLQSQATESLDDPWFRPDQPPVLLAVGRLAPQKDYPTLFRAMAKIQKKRRIRLVILGEGSERTALENLGTQLGLNHDIRLPGFVANPYKYMAHASAFVLSSAWEGFPNVLLEALACGCPVISTDCPSGPGELLSNGIYGPLIHVGDDAGLAAAILSVLDSPPDATWLKTRAEMFSIDTIANHYLQALL